MVATKDLVRLENVEVKIRFRYTIPDVVVKDNLKFNGPIFLYDYGVILSTFGLRLKFLNFCLHNKKF